MECTEAVPRRKCTAVNAYVEEKKEKDLRSITYSSILETRKRRAN